MERIVRDITERLTQKLPADRDFYSPEDLQVLEIPEFITDRVILEMNQNLNESLSPPDTEWASMKEESVQFAWKNFIEAIKAEVRMPATYARSLFETAVADTLELAVQPRKAIPETLFGVDQMLSVDILKKRVTYITIGRKLAAALVRYMERKNRRTLKLEECRKIVTGVDERLVQDYNSLDWAKELDPLFLLAGPAVDTELLRIYFEDKEMPVLAARFDRLNKTVTRNDMIEVISKPVIEDPQSVPRDVSQNDEASARRTPGTNGSSPLGEAGLSDSGETDRGQGPSYIPEDSILASFQRKRGDSPEEDPRPDAEAPQSETGQINKELNTCGYG
jgi:hypothetical protein